VHPTGDVKIRLLVREQIDKKDLRPEGMGREREIAVLFADIRNFTSFSESHMAFDVLHLLNRYFDRMGTIIDFNHGDVIAFLGDGIVCFFEDTDAKGPLSPASLRAPDAEGGQRVLALLQRPLRLRGTDRDRDCLGVRSDR
jgi:class 3 adenylate cyclase